MKKNKILSALLSLTITASAINVFPANAVEIVDSGQCGDSAYWTLDSEGNFTVTGTGTMWEWQCSYMAVGVSEIVIHWIEGKECPWYGIRDRIKTLTISEGITYLGGLAFINCDNLTTVSLPDSLLNCGIGSTFCHCDNLTGIVLPDSLEIINDCFSYCPKITSIDIPETVTHIADSAFDMCAGLKTVIVRTKECYLPPSDSVISNGRNEITRNRFYNGIIYCWEDSDMADYCVAAGLDYVPFSHGDVNIDGSIDSIDASLVLTEYARVSTGEVSGFDSVETFCADVDSDENVNASDASSVLSYYAYAATGGTDSLEDFLKRD